MDIIHVMNDPLPRLIVDSLSKHLDVMPAVIVSGARQTGKSTLAQHLTPGPRKYFTLDDIEVLEVASEDPEALVGGRIPVTLDEVQREPNLLLSIKREIDRERSPGRFLLTGSANLLLMQRVSETLAGRASYINLWPMTRREQLGLAACGAWEILIGESEDRWMDILSGQSTPSEDWSRLARRGGFPTPALELKEDHERSVWFDGYVKTYLERDLQHLSAISALPDFRRLMRAACLRMGQLVNQTDMGRDVGLPQSTVHRYLNLLETSYLLVRLPAFSVNRTKRLVKSPKLYWSDTGLAMHIAQVPEPSGPHLENLVLCDLLAWRDGRMDQADVFYWRTTTGEEVDFVIEVGQKLLPIEVKATSKPRLSDTKHLRAFREEYGDRVLPGVLLHTGTTLDWITADVLACPWWRLF